MKNLAIITARGGSKRVPRKNIREFCGKPILAYSIEAALQSGLFSEVMVSTEDEEIAAIAKKYGAEVPFYRTEATANDFAGTRDVLEEVIRMYAERGKTFDYMCCIYPTAPFVTPEKLQMAYDMLLDTGADAVSPMVRFSFPPQRSFYIRDGKPVALHPEMLPCRSQDLEPIYHDVGQFYFYRMSTFFDEGEKDSRAIELSDLEVQDIDNLEDWEIAEMKYRLMMDKRNRG